MVTFSPQFPGNRNGMLQIFNSESETSPLIVSLYGTGLAAPQVSLTPTRMSFPGQEVGTTSASQTITLTNTGSAGLNIAAISATGDFGQTNTCPATLDVGVSCTIAVIFSPTAQGMRTGTIAISDDAASSPQSVALSGTGVVTAISLSTNLP